MKAVMQTNDIKRDEIISYNPATTEEIGRLPNMTDDEVSDAVKRARIAQNAWKQTTFEQRAKIVMKAREIVLEEMDTIAELISRENGKPKIESYTSEIVGVCDLMNYFAKNTRKLLKSERIGLGLWTLQGRGAQLVYQPLGVVAIISPWNFPFSIPMGEVVPALMSGNAVVLKPSEITPFSALEIGDIFQKAGLPDNVLQILTGDGRVGAALVEAKPDKILFTGSVNTGKRIAAAAAKNLTPVVLELGGKDPMIVLEDANLEIAVQAAVWGAFVNSGQACASVERCYVHESIAEKFIARAVELTNKLKQNIGLNEETEVGSMTSETQLAIVQDHVEDFRKEGANILTGGKRNANFKGAFFEPTVITGVSHKMRGMCEETFGPTLPIMTFKTEQEAIDLANDTEFGLSAYIFTKNIARGKRIAEKLNAGTVMVNEVLYTHTVVQTPWGGVKNSGYGRTHGKQGLMELVTPKHVHVNRISFLPDLWWFGYSGKAIEMFKGMARHYTTGSVFQTARLLPKMLARFKELKKR